MQQLFFMLTLLVSQTNETASPVATNSIQTPAASESLQAFRPPAGTTVEPKLFLEPNDKAPILRQLQSTDRIVYLRTRENWYEVDLKTQEGLEFRGWLKGSKPVERELPAASEIPKAFEKKPTQTEDPFKVKGVTWFWSDDAKHWGALRFGMGMQNIFYRLKGDVTDSTTGAVTRGQTIRPGYNFFGWHLYFQPEFIPLETKLWGKTLMGILRANYEFGLHRVSFSNPFVEEPGVAGKAYSILTNLFEIEGLARYRAGEFKRGFLQFGLGLGFLYYETSPDLEPVPNIAGAVNPGQVIFADTGLTALTIPVEVWFQFLDHFYVQPRVSLFLMPEFRSSASGTPGLKASGLPLSLEGTFGYQWSDSWALEAGGRFLSAKGSGDASSSTRLGNTYANGNVDMSYWRGSIGLRWAY